MNKQELTDLMNEYLIVSDEWDGAKIADFKFAEGLIVIGIDDVAEEIIKRYAAALNRTCKWTLSVEKIISSEITIRTYKTECNKLYVTNSNDIKDGIFSHCNFCGGRIET